MCCQYGNGSFRVMYDNEEVVVGGEFGAVFSQSFGKASTIASTAEASPFELDTSYDKNGNGITDVPKTLKCLIERVFELFTSF